MRHPPLLLLGALLTAGAGCSPDSAVLDAPDTVVWLETDHHELTPGSPTYLRLLYDHSVHGCLELEEVQATQNGRVLRQLSPGGEIAPGIMQPGGCAMPLFEAFTPDPSEALTAFVLSAGERTLVAEFQHPSAPLRLRLREPADGQLRPGMRAVVEYFPPTDVLLSPTLVLGQPGTYPGTPSAEPLRNEPGTLTFTVPLGYAPGDTQLSLLAFTYSGTQLCTAGRCRNRSLKEATLPVSIAAPVAGQGAP